MRGNAVGTVLGLVVLGLLFWVFKAGYPGSMRVMGMALANPETQQEKVLVDHIGVHSIVGNGAMIAEQETEAEGHAWVDRRPSPHALLPAVRTGVYDQDQEGWARSQRADRRVREAMKTRRDRRRVCTEPSANRPDVPNRLRAHALERWTAA